MSDGLPASADLVRFDGFTLDLRSEELTRAGRVVPLPRQARLLLSALATRPGELVTRAELRRVLWPDGTHVEFDAGLNFCVNRLRRALGDHARAPHFIETVPGRGYRFVHPVVRATAAEPAPGRPVAAAAGPSLRRRRHRQAALLALVLLCHAPGRLRVSRAHEEGVGSRVAAAQSAFDRGRRALEGGPAQWGTSVALFTEAARRDPGFAVALFGIADVSLRQADHRAAPPHEAYPRARDALFSALEIEDRAEVRVALARVRLAYDRDWPAALREVRRARRLDPRLVSARLLESGLLSAAARHDEALRLMEETIALFPGRADVQRELGWASYRAGRFDRAARAWRDWAHLQPRETEPYHRLVFAHRAKGEVEEAREAARVVLAMGGVPDARLRAFAARPAPAAVESYLAGSLRWLRDPARAASVPADAFAVLEAALGRDLDAIEDLERAADEHSPTLLTSLADPDVLRLRGDARLLRLLARVGSPLLAGPAAGPWTAPVAPVAMRP